ncbi:MAG TPA: hypothetical protein VFA98_15665, partial [Thermoanaerobaculia bacterium]|nr:hypothetical protein [Thermoanaerobaculia bacterium]
VANVIVVPMAGWLSSVFGRRNYFAGSIMLFTAASFFCGHATGNFTKVVQRVPVKIVLDEPPDPAHPLRAGMSVTATVDVRS